MRKERREQSDQDQEPDRSALTSVSQNQTISLLERSGWRLLYVRRPMFQDIVAVMGSLEGQHFTGVDDHGRVIDATYLSMREQDAGYATRNPSWYTGNVGGGSMML